jgi:hypothetical protein
MKLINEEGGRLQLLLTNDKINFPVMSPALPILTFINTWCNSCPSFITNFTVLHGIAVS